jgi:hypothetical protein
MSQWVEMDGALRLEGAFLEKVFAAYAISKGLKVIPRPATEGKQHDVLLDQYNGYIHCECTGLAEITGSKVERFLNDTMELHDRLSRKHGRGVVEAWFIVASHENAWTAEAAEEFQKAKSLLKEKSNIETKIISSNQLLLELLKSGVLGIRLVRDRVFWASPEDMAIRYSPSQKCFVYDRCGEHVLNELRRTHFSLLPSFYWDSYYRTILEEAIKDKAELPLSVFSYPYPAEGLQWRSLTNLVDCYGEYLNSFSRTYVLEKGRDFILELHTSKRGHDYYTLHIFTLGEQRDSGARYVSSNLVSTLKGRAYIIIEDLKKTGKIPKDERVGIHIVSSTQYWTPQAWGEGPEIPDVLKEELYIEHKPGNELLKDLLNIGILGFRFRERNQVTLVGPRVEAVRLSSAGAGELLFKDQ